MSAQSSVEEIIRTQRENSDETKLFALADAAQNSDLPHALDALGTCGCLFEVGNKSGLACNAPHLVQLPPFDSGHKAWRWILGHGPRQPCVTVLSAALGFIPLLDRLRALAEVQLPDGSGMFFAFWDPALLGSLVGQLSDKTLHVAGPILTTDQRAALLHGVNGWWYWDRGGSTHSIRIPTSAGPQTKAPFVLTQPQVDDLVEASVPDHIKYHIEVNQAHLFDSLPANQRYQFVRTRLAAGRAIGLERMVDLVNYTCASLLYQERMETDPVIAALTSRVKRGEMDFGAAMNEFP